MGAALGVNVALMSDDGYTPVTFLAGTARADLPEWAQERITNPDVWVDEDEAPRSTEASDSSDGASPDPEEASSLSAAEEVEDPSPEDSGDGPSPDPKEASSLSAAAEADGSSSDEPDKDAPAKASDEDSEPAPPPAEKPRRRRS